MTYHLRHVSNSYVTFEAILPWKARLVMLTMIWFLFGMNSYVILLQKFFAKLTLKWFVLGMGSYKCGSPSA